MIVQPAGEQRGADEVGDVARPGMSGYLGERSGLSDAALVEHHHAIGERVGVHRIVGHEEADAVERLEMATEVAAHVVAGAGVEGGQRLVEEEKRGLGCEGARQCTRCC